MSALNLWNKNTERVADALSRDNRRGQFIDRLQMNSQWFKRR